MSVVRQSGSRVALLPLLFFPLLLAGCGKEVPVAASLPEVPAWEPLSNELYVAAAAKRDVFGPHQGFAILGNHFTCGVYGEGKKNKALTTGLTHYYIDDFTRDHFGTLYPAVRTPEGVYCAIGRFEHGGERFEKPENATWMERYFQPYTVFPVGSNAICETRVYVPESSGLVFRESVTNAPAGSLLFVAHFGKDMPTVTADETNRALLFAYPYGGKLLLGFRTGGIAFAWTTNMQDLFGGPFGQTLRAKNALLLIYRIAPTNETGFTGDELTIAPYGKRLNGFDILTNLRAVPDTLALAEKKWDAWLSEGIVPSFDNPAADRAWKANLSALLGVFLDGAIPADVTGQFVTSDMPQLYPRDALMCARSFFLSGHTAEAARILNFWNTVSNHSPGEFYARYDAHANPVNSGSGARYDVPEWDFNGYYMAMCLWIWERTGKWTGDLSTIRRMAEFIEKKADADGKLLEGGIIEWPGFLPATHMNVIAGIHDAAAIFYLQNDLPFAKRCLETAKKLEAGLAATWNAESNTYMDLRNGKFAYCSSFNFGWLWGYTNHDRLASANEWTLANNVKNGGGVQYFDGKGGAEDYGRGLFFFTTGAAAQYQAEHGSRAGYELLTTWMRTNANWYLMMPERIFWPGKPFPAPASPLSWCNGEFANALLAGAERGWDVVTNDQTRSWWLADRAEALERYLPVSGKQVLEEFQYDARSGQFDKAKRLFVFRTADLMPREEYFRFRAAKLLEEIAANLE
jgi:hypothetical protein